MSRACRAQILPLNYTPYQKKMFLAVVFLPLVNAILAGLTGRLLGRKGACALTITGMLITLTASYIIFLNNLVTPTVHHLKLGT